MSTVDALLTPVRARLSAATPGTWRWDEEFGEAGDTGLALTNDAGAEIVGAYNHHCCSFRDDPNVKDNDAALIASAPTDLARLLAAVEAVTALHRKSPIYDTWVEDCGHNFECDGFEGTDGYSYCPESISGYTCSECAELNKDNPEGELPDWPCPTVAAVVSALGEGK